jgi:hypothetical protein
MLNLRSRHRLTKFVLLGAVLARVSTAAVPAGESCSPAQVGPVLASKLAIAWNQGTVRAWDVTGEFWSASFNGELTSLGAMIRVQFDKICNVAVYPDNGLTIRIVPRSLTVATQESVISPVGTTIGVLGIAAGEQVIFMYPAKIAAAIARGKGQSVNSGVFKSIAQFPHELDLEYNFGKTIVSILSTSGKKSLRTTAEMVFRDLRSQGFQPTSGSESAIDSLDSVFVSRRHESFWIHSQAVARVEFEQLKRGITRVNIHETRQVR